MDMSGEYVIAAPRQAVWEALNDPEILKQCIPGCESVDKTSDTSFEAKVTAKVGPVRAKFSGKVNMSDIDPPSGYTISGEGTGGAAGFAKGGAKVALSDDPEGTKLEYSVDATVGGKLAQIGSRLIDSTAKKMANDFFGKFAELVAANAEGSAATEAEPETIAPTEETAPQATDSDEEKKGLSPMVWIAGVIVIALALVFAFQG
jgi:carbon monoxide dehydrogenase subunit G